MSYCGTWDLYRDAKNDFSSMRRAGDGLTNHQEFSLGTNPALAEHGKAFYTLAWSLLIPV